MKTDTTANIGKHAFEVAGLGLAPFRFIGASENVITFPDGTQKAGGSCDYCGTGIRTECVIMSADGKQSKVGCNCIEKVGDTGIMKAYKSSREYRDKQRQIRNKKAAAIFQELTALIQANSDLFSSQPHPYGFTDRKTGVPLTYLDSVNWMMNASGNKGRAGLLTSLKTRLICGNRSPLKLEGRMIHCGETEF